MTIHSGALQVTPPAAIIVRVPGVIFNLADFQRVYPLHTSPEDLKMEYIHGGSDLIRGFSLDEFHEALRAASPPAELQMPSE